MNKDYLHILGRVFGTPLAIHPDKLAVVVSVLGHRLGLDGEQIQAAAKHADGVGNVLPGPLASVPGAIKSDKPYVLTQSGIAVIPVLGTLVHRAASANPPSMFWSYGEIENMFLDAVTDPHIKGVMFNINSGGGEVSGVFDLAQQIHAARGIKPIWAAADEHAFSAAYALASAAERVTVAQTGAVGSVGVIAMHQDVSAQDKGAGLKYTAVYAGARKNDYTPHEPLTDEARSRLQASVDKTYDLFVNTVAKHRGISVDRVKATEADVFGGIDGSAVQSGLADAVMPFRDSLRALTEHVEQPKQTYFIGAGSAASQPGNHEETPMPNANTPAPTMDAKPAETITTAVTPTPPETAAADTPAVKASDDNVVDIAAARNEGLKAGQAAAGEIAQLCVLAGRTDLTAGYLGKNMTAAQVRDDLVRQRAMADDQLSTSSLHGGGDENGQPGATLSVADVYKARAKSIQSPKR